MDFWESIDALITSTEIIIDRVKGSGHPRFPEMIYPLDYGYLKGTKANDGSEIDVWRGTKEIQSCDAVICTVDNLKKDSEIKLLLGCTESQKQQILALHNSSEYMAAIIVQRSK